MPWQAKLGCAKHHIAAIERLINSFSPAWLLPPRTGEIFASKEEGNRRLSAFALAEGFDVVRSGGDTGANPAWRFGVFHHGSAWNRWKNRHAAVQGHQPASSMVLDPPVEFIVILAEKCHQLQLA